MPIIAPSIYALTSTESFLAYLGELPDESGAQNDRAQMLINGYSKAAKKFLKRQLKPVEAASDKIFAYRGNGFLALQGYEATAIHTVTMHTDLPTSGWVVLANQDASTEASWRPNPRNKTEETGTYWSLTLPEVGAYHPYFNEPLTSLNRRNLGYQVTVNADWGAGVVPDDVQLAIWIACANAWRNPEAYASRQLGPLSATDYGDVTPGEEEGLSLPRASRALLSGYRRRSTGVR